MMPKPKVNLKAARKKDRQNVGTLRDNRVNPTTLQRYIYAGSMFQLFLTANQFPEAKDLEELDTQLCSFIESLWEEGEAKSLAADSISSAQHFLLTRRVFPGAWHLYSIWCRLELPKRAPPLPVEVAKAIVGYALSLNRVDYAALVLLGFHCSLRTMEMLQSQCGHFSFDSNWVGAVTLPWTKIGQQRGAQEVVTITEPLVGFLISSAAKNKSLHSCVLNGSVAAFRTFWKESLDILQVKSSNFQPYSLRRGGATFDYLFHQDIKRTLMRGRWSDLRTARIYITEGQAMLTSLHLSQSALGQIKRYTAVLDQWVSQQHNGKARQGKRGRGP